ncbi:MAG: hypothetical protein U1E76_27355 [Planctomycetota bacterium]
MGQQGWARFFPTMPQMKAARSMRDRPPLMLQPAFQMTGCMKLSAIDDFGRIRATARGGAPARRDKVAWSNPRNGRHRKQNSNKADQQGGGAFMTIDKQQRTMAVRSRRVTVIATTEAGAVRAWIQADGGAGPGEQRGTHHGGRQLGRDAAARPVTRTSSGRVRDD